MKNQKLVTQQNCEPSALRELVAHVCDDLGLPTSGPEFDDIVVSQKKKGAEREKIGNQTEQVIQELRYLRRHVALTQRERKERLARMTTPDLVDDLVLDDLAKMDPPADPNHANILMQRRRFKEEEPLLRKHAALSQRKLNTQLREKECEERDLRGQLHTPSDIDEHFIRVWFHYPLAAEIAAKHPAKGDRPALKRTLQILGEAVEKAENSAWRRAVWKLRNLVGKNGFDEFAEIVWLMLPACDDRGERVLNCLRAEFRIPTAQFLWRLAASPQPTGSEDNYSLPWCAKVFHLLNRGKGWEDIIKALVKAKLESLQAGENAGDAIDRVKNRWHRFQKTLLSKSNA